MILPPILAFLIGLVFGSYFPYFPSSTLFLLMTCGLILVWGKRSGHFPVSTSGILFSCLIAGVLWWNLSGFVQERNDLGRWMNIKGLQVLGKVIHPVKRASDRLMMIVQVSHVRDGDQLHSTSGLLRLTWRQADQAVHQGDDLEVTLRLRAPYGTLNPGGFHYGHYLRRKGIHAVATVSGPEDVRIRDSTAWEPLMAFWGQVDEWRATIQRAAIANLKEPALGLFLGMIIGEQSFITPDVRDAFMATGTVHIISISGSHLGLIAFLVFFIVKGLILRLPASWLEWLSLHVTATRLAVLLTIPCVSFYTLMAGGEVATVRSWIMIILFLLAVWMGRHQQLLTALAIAAVVVLVSHPPALHDISFQLSYLAVFAIALVMQTTQSRSDEEQEIDERALKQEGLLASTWKWVKQVSLITLAVTLVTLPLVAYYFNQIAWLGLLTNLVVIPFVGVLLIPLGLICAVWVLITGSETLPLAFLNQGVSDLLVQVVAIIARIPGAKWHVASPSILAMGLFYSLLLGTMLLMNRPRLRWTCAISMVLVLLWWAWSPRLDIDENTLRVAFLDVGQGDATVLELPGGQTILIDGGPKYRRLDMGQAVIGPYLWDRGIRRLDHVIATHPQWDHVGGLPWILKTFEVGQYWSNGVTRGRQFYQRLEQSLLETNMQDHHAQDGQMIAKTNSCVLKVMNPLLKTTSQSSTGSAMKSGSALNNRSLVTHLTCGPHSVLFTADVEHGALRHLHRLPESRRARVIKVPHHGAKSSLHKEWIENLEAEVAVISVGQHNRYGHPYPTVIEAYAQEGIPLYRTDRDGAVWITASLDSSDMTIQTARERMLQPIRLEGNVLEDEWRNLGRLWNKWTSGV